MTYSVMLVSDISQQNESIIHIYLLFQILSYVSHHRVLSRVPCVTEQGLVQLLSRVRLCDPMDCSTPGFPIHHQLLELAQIHVRQVSDAIQPSHLCCPLLTFCLHSFPASGCFPMSWLFALGDQSIVASTSVLPTNIQG